MPFNFCFSQNDLFVLKTKDENTVLLPSQWINYQNRNECLEIYVMLVEGKMLQYNYL